MSRLLSFDEDKSAVLSLEELDLTLKLEDGAGRLPKSAPIDHANLFKKLLGMAQAHVPDYDPHIGGITIKQNNCKRIMWRGKAEECPLENYQIERVVSKINFIGARSFEGIEDTEGNMAIGISYNERGVQIAVGHNVRVCQNLNVFGENVFSTYGSNAVPFEKGMQLVQHWMQNLNPIMDQNREYIGKLQEIKIDEDSRLRLFGKIYEMAIRANEGDKNDAPLNVSECNKMVASGFHHIVKHNGEVSAWNLTNWATDVLKPNTSDMVHILHKNARLNNFILREFGLN